MSQLCNSQKEFSERISKLYINLKKASKSRYSRGYLETRQDLLNEYWTKYITQHDEIIKTISSDILEKIDFDPVDDFDKIEEVYLDCKTLLRESLDELPKPTPSSSEQPPQNIIVENKQFKPKLPPISIPKFSGNYNDWLSYRDIFTSLIHNDTTISKVEKHQYLKSTLTGEAEQLLKHFALTEANYDKAWKTLEDRYNNKRLIVNNILHRLLSQKKINSECSRGLKEILDTTKECLNSLENLDIEVSNWDAIVVYIVVSKLDPETHKYWEQSLGSSLEIPSFTSLCSYLECRFRALEMVNNNIHRKETSTKKESHKPTTQQKSTVVKSFATELSSTCTYCSQNHYICHCKEFASLDIPQRQDFVKRNQICFNCLVKGHSVNKCRQSTSCKKCGRRHHTLLHFTNPNKSTSASESETEKLEAQQHLSMKTETHNGSVVLATALIEVIAKNGSTHKLRALVDQGSQASFVTEATAQILNLERVVVNGKITGISDTAVITTKAMVNLQFHSIYDPTQIIKTQAYVLKRLTSLLPSQELPTDSWPLLDKLKLADPQFHKPGCIDILLGADVHAKLMLDGLQRHNSLIALNSRLGWLISGQITGTDLNTHHVVVTHTKLELDQLLRRFWELEEHTSKDKSHRMTQLESQCDEHYKNTHTRNADGRYIVHLPFKGDDSNLGDTKRLALNRLLQMEKRFKHKPDFKQEYVKFLTQYEAQGHMEIVPEKKEEINVPEKEEQKENKIYYLPHHAVIKESSTSTKLRVVFDGSAKPEKGNSLNEELLIGPPLQQDIKDLVTRWRQHKICLVADIQQMYRQILISPDDANYQRILWRDTPEEDIKEYRLLTVTYGTSCAPYLAIRTLHQLADDELAEFSDVALKLKSDLYMDDLMTGTSNEEDTVNLQINITELLKRGGFLLHKWSSNSEYVLSKIPSDDITTKSVVNIKMDDSIKALGIAWNPQSDNFELIMNFDSDVDNITKRSVLSTIAKTFDPLGWLAPLVITLKIFMQKLWLAGLEWDDVLTDDLKYEWCTYIDNFTNMENIQLPRWIGTLESQDTKVELHGFSDASCAAYSCVVYLRVLNGNKITVRLIAAKSKVSPVKQVSLPRLELCGAVLLAKMLHDIKTSLSIEDDCIFAWTDSTIVLAWLRKVPNTWTTFVANRTAEILTHTNSSQWHHVISSENPADLASRGTNPDNLRKSELWWTGPSFLRENKEIYYSKFDVPDTNLESKLKLTINVCINEDDFANAHLNRFSNLTKLIRVTAYCLKFVKLIKIKKECKDNLNITNYLSSEELLNARKVCIRLSQLAYFKSEIKLLSQGKPVLKSSALHTLNPFLDNDQIVRVGGRLANANIPYDSKSPVVLSSKCHFAHLLVTDTHLKTLHGGPQLTLNVINSHYWIVGVKSLVKRIVRKCIPCFKQRATPTAPFMGNLPQCRLQPTRPFRSSGVDFAGPFTLKLYSGRCNKTTKGYISLFICTVTKAIHLELVEDLSTAAFLAAFKRFTSRRGYCSDLYSDCGTNFVGASRELETQFKNAKSNLVQEISELLANDYTTWHFIPPGAPHFGGLWESGVRSIKGHLKRVIGQTSLTFVEFYTLLTQVEACVNSRPLTLISSSLDDPPLTPSHFLIGETLITVPEENVENPPLSYLNRWQTVQRMVQSLWRRWQSEYLHTLQHRYKWTKQQPDIKLGTIVLIKDDRLPPGKWLLGRVIDKHPGADGITRVVTLQNKNNTFKRPVTKLCPLPLEPTEDVNLC